MNKIIVAEEIDQMMETLAEQWDIMRKYKSRIPLIEVDIFKDNIRNLYELLLQLEKMNEKGLNEIEKLPAEDNKVHIAAPVAERAPEPVAKQVVIAPAAEVVVIQEPPLPEPFPIPPLEIVTLPPAQETFSGTLTGADVDEATEDVPQPLPPQALNDSPPIAEKNPNSGMPDLFGSHTTSLADKYQADKKTIKDQLSDQKDDNSIGSKMQQSQINDLKSAIGINDKFLFINELFKGDLAGYNRTIETLNACQSRQDANEKLDALRMQYKWSEQSVSVQRLRNFIRRRFFE